MLITLLINHSKSTVISTVNSTDYIATALKCKRNNSAVLKYIIMFVVIISLAGEVFKFVFLNMSFSMGKPKAQVDTPVVAV